MASKRYPNRSDLRNPAGKIAQQAAPGQTYGAATEQMRAQQAVPMGGPPTAAAPQQPAPPQPGSLGALDRPTERPYEEPTFGSSIGPGPGPEVMGMNPGIPEQWSKVDLIERVRAIASMYPSAILYSFLAELEQS